jgi:hypothetical protein
MTTAAGRSKLRGSAAEPHLARRQDWVEVAQESFRLAGVTGERRAMNMALERTLLLRTRQPDHPVRICCFGAHTFALARLVADFGRAKEKALQITAVEMHADFADVAREVCADYPEIGVLHADPRKVLLKSSRDSHHMEAYQPRLPGASPSDSSEDNLPALSEPFDWIVVSNFFHFCDEGQVPSWLRLMTESSTCGWVVSEPTKATMANSALKLRLGLARANGLYRQQVQQAIQRAFTYQEWYMMVRRSFIRSASVRRGSMGRVIAQRIDKNVVIVK